MLLPPTNPLRCEAISREIAQDDIKLGLGEIAGAISQTNRLTNSIRQLGLGDALGDSRLGRCLDIFQAEMLGLGNDRAMANAKVSREILSDL